MDKQRVDDQHDQDTSFRATLLQLQETLTGKTVEETTTPTTTMKIGQVAPVQEQNEAPKRRGRRREDEDEKKTSPERGKHHGAVPWRNQKTRHETGRARKAEHRNAELQKQVELMRTGFEGEGDDVRGWLVNLEDETLHDRSLPDVLWELEARARTAQLQVKPLERRADKLRQEVAQHKREAARSARAQELADQETSELRVQMTRAGSEAVLHERGRVEKLQVRVLETAKERDEVRQQLHALQVEAVEAVQAEKQEEAAMEQDSAREQRAALQLEKDALTEDLRMMTQERDNAHESLDQMAADNEEAVVCAREAAVREVSAVLQERDDMQEQICRLEDQVAQLQLEMRKGREGTLATVRSHVAVVVEERDAARMGLAQVTASYDTRHEENEQLQKRVADLERFILVWEEEAKSLAQDNDRLVTELQEAKVRPLSAAAARRLAAAMEEVDRLSEKWPGQWGLSEEAIIRLSGLTDEEATASLTGPDAPERVTTRTSSQAATGIDQAGAGAESVGSAGTLAPGAVSLHDMYMDMGGSWSRQDKKDKKARERRNRHERHQD